jgi:hypothetical protein
MSTTTVQSEAEDFIQPPQITGEALQAIWPIMA